MKEQIEKEIKGRLRDEKAQVIASIFDGYYLMTVFWDNKVKYFTGIADSLSQVRERKIKPWLREEMLNKQ